MTYQDLGLGGSGAATSRHRCDKIQEATAAFLKAKVRFWPARMFSSSRFRAQRHTFGPESALLRARWLNSNPIETSGVTVIPATKATVEKIKRFRFAVLVACCINQQVHTSIIDSSICVATITGLPWRLQQSIIRFWVMGTISGGISTPRSPLNPSRTHNTEVETEKQVGFTILSMMIPSHVACSHRDNTRHFQQGHSKCHRRKQPARSKIMVLRNKLILGA